MWTEQEKAKLIELYPYHTNAELEAILNKTPGQVRGMKGTLGLNSKFNPFSDEEKEKIRAFYISHPDAMDLESFAKELGRQKTSISRFARRENLTKYSRKLTDEQYSTLVKVQHELHESDYYKEVVAPQISKSLHEWHMTHEHPRGMLGKHHTPEICARISEAQRDLWANKSEEERAEISAARRAWQIQYGHESDENTYSRCVRGKRADLGNVFFRSRWEANIARILNKFDIAWEYEPRRFKFPDMGDSVLSYCPDFYCTNLDVWIEVKGWFDENSVKRLERFKKYYPDEYEKLAIVDEPVYRDLEKQYADTITNWEYRKTKMNKKEI